MKGETQSIHLQKMMQQRKCYPEYALALPLFPIKKKSFKKITKSDVLLVGLDHLDLILLKEGEICAKVAVENVADSTKLRISSLVETSENTIDSKKYKNLLPVFATLQIRKLEVGHKVEIPTVEINETEIFSGHEKCFKGVLVMVDDEIAIEITEVFNG